MKEIRQIIRQQLLKLYESENKSGEYSTQEMDNFLSTLINTVEWGNRPHIILPSSLPSSSVSYTSEASKSNWDKAKQYHSDPNTKWYIWDAKVGGNLNKPTYLSKQRIDLDSILNIVSKYPESFSYITIGVDNDLTKNYQKNISTQGD